MLQFDPALVAAIIEALEPAPTGEVTDKTATPSVALAAGGTGLGRVSGCSVLETEANGLFGLLGRSVIST